MIRNGTLVCCLITLFGLTRPAQAQVYTQRVSAGSSLSRWGIMGDMNSIPAVDLPEIDLTPLLTEDEQRTKQGLPLRFGVSLPVSVDLMQAGGQAQQGAVRVHSYRINAPGALAVSVLFDRLHLVEGAKVFIYDANKTMLFGPITASQNSTNFWTDFLAGSSVIIEVQEPVQSAGQSVVQVAGVVHSYRNVTGSPKSFGTVGGSGACEVNLVCQPAYQTEGDGVALILASYGGYTYACTGAMLNSARQDFRSYFLTAFHCVDFNGDGTLGSGETAAYANAQFRFNWQSPTCTPSQEDPTYVTLSGAALKAARSQSDFSLLELNAQPPQTENITYLGWNRSPDNATSVATIHHPQGDVKKISFGGVTTVSGYGTVGNDHLTAFWTVGATEGGSSGSPLLDQNRRIIGQLHGGPSYCGAPAASLKDYYGRFYTSWDVGGTMETQLRDFLDPADTGVLTTDEAKAAISGVTSFTGSASFALNVGAGTSVSWSVSNGASAVFLASGSGNGPVAALRASGTANNTPVTLVFSVNAGQPYPILFTRTITVTAAPQALALTAPTYNCRTGAFRFNTVGDNPALTIEYRAVGISDWSINPSQFVEVPLRTDPSISPFRLQARYVGQPGSEVMLAWSLLTTCQNGGPISAAPVFNGPVPVVYTNNLATYQVPLGLFSDPNGEPLTYSATNLPPGVGFIPVGRQLYGYAATPGSYTIILTATNLQNLSASGPLVLVSAGFGNPLPLRLTTPTYDCQTGAIRFNTAGGNGSAVEYRAVGITDWTTNPAQVIAFSLRTDPSISPFTLEARYVGQPSSEVTFSWSLQNFCPTNARLSASEPTAPTLVVRVLGNPVQSVLWAEVAGGAGQSLRWQVCDLTGRVLEERHTTPPNGTDQQQFIVKNQPAGLLLLRVSTPGQTKTVRVILP